MEMVAVATLTGTVPDMLPSVVNGTTARNKINIQVGTVEDGRGFVD